MTENEKKVVFLETENQNLKAENKKLREENQKLTRKCQFYEKNMHDTMNAHHEESCPDDDIKIVTGDGEYYQRVGSRTDNKKFMKSFLLLTVFTIVIQTIDTDFASRNVFTVGSPSATLNAYEPSSNNELSPMRCAY
jgi:hypothetical protein